MPPEIGTSTQADGHQQGEQLLYFQYSCFLPYIFIYISGMRKKKLLSYPEAILHLPYYFHLLLVVGVCTCFFLSLDE